MDIAAGRSSGGDNHLRDAGIGAFQRAEAQFGRRVGVFQRVDQFPRLAIAGSSSSGPSSSGVVIRLVVIRIVVIRIVVSSPSSSVRQPGWAATATDFDPLFSTAATSSSCEP